VNGETQRIDYPVKQIWFLRKRMDMWKQLIGLNKKGINKFKQQVDLPFGWDIESDRTFVRGLVRLGWNRLQLLWATEPGLDGFKDFFKETGPLMHRLRVILTSNRDVPHVTFGIDFEAITCKYTPQKVSIRELSSVETAVAAVPKVDPQCSRAPAGFAFVSPAAQAEVHPSAPDGPAKAKQDGPDQPAEPKPKRQRQPKRKPGELEPVATAPHARQFLEQKSLQLFGVTADTRQLTEQKPLPVSGKVADPRQLIEEKPPPLFGQAADARQLIEQKPPAVFRQLADTRQLIEQKGPPVFAPRPPAEQNAPVVFTPLQAVEQKVQPTFLRPGPVREGGSLFGALTKQESQALFGTPQPQPTFGSVPAQESQSPFGTGLFFSFEQSPFTPLSRTSSLGAAPTVPPAAPLSATCAPFFGQQRPKTPFDDATAPASSHQVFGHGATPDSFPSSLRDTPSTDFLFSFTPEPPPTPADQPPVQKKKTMTKPLFDSSILELFSKDPLLQPISPPSPTPPPVPPPVSDVPAFGPFAMAPPPPPQERPEPIFPLPSYPSAPSWAPAQPAKPPQPRKPPKPPKPIREVKPRPSRPPREAKPPGDGLAMRQRTRATERRSLSFILPEIPQKITFLP
jgi:hypothetical protein